MPVPQLACSATRADRLNSHDPLWLSLVFHPAPWMLLLDPAQLHFTLRPQVLARKMLSHHQSEWNRVQKYVLNVPSDVASARRTLRHLLRTSTLALQLCNHGRIVDFTAGELLSSSVSEQHDA